MNPTLLHHHGIVPLTETISLVPVQRSDLSQLRSYLEKLAAHERRPGAVRTNIPQLASLLFGDQQQSAVATAWMIRDNRVEGEQDIGGVIVSDSRFSTFQGKRSVYLEDVYIEPEYRGQGLGSKIMAWLGDVTVLGDYAGLELSLQTGNDGARAAYMRSGAMAEVGTEHFHFPDAAIQHLSEQHRANQEALAA